MAKDDERWRWVSGYQGLYLVSNHGRILAIPKCGRDACVLKPFTSNGGYQIVSLSDKSGNCKKHLVHRIVAEEFCTEKGPDCVVNHIDGNKQNNHASNLEWVTRSENELHKRRILKKGLNRPKARKLTSDQVRDIRASSLGVTKLARKYGVHRTSISQIVNWKTYRDVI